MVVDLTAIPRFPDHLPDLAWFYMEWGQEYLNYHDVWRVRWQRQRLSEAQNHRCCYCGDVMADWDVPCDQQATIEHVTRKVEGGTDDWENLAAACRLCNNTRNDMPPLEWAWRRGHYSRARVRILVDL